MVTSDADIERHLDDLRRAVEQRTDALARKIDALEAKLDAAEHRRWSEPPRLVDYFIVLWVVIGLTIVLSR